MISEFRLMKLPILFSLLLIIIIQGGCASNKDSGKDDSPDVRIDPPQPAPAPGTAVAEVKIINADQAPDNKEWILDLEVTKIIAYGSSTKPLPATFESFKLSKNIIEKSDKKTFRKNEKMIFIFAGQQSMDQTSSWAIIEIREI